MNSELDYKDWNVTPSQPLGEEGGIERAGWGLMCYIPHHV